jgi:hypothetical protein
MKKGIANLPLHGGRAPRWLFGRMVALSREITRVIVEDYGTTFFLQRLSDPYWFQSLGCVLGFDWHSSGVTTTTCGAIKEALKDVPELGIYVCGGKGGTSRNAPQEIEHFCQAFSIDPKPLVYASKMSAKVDNTALQDGYQLYHHNFFFNSAGTWTVVQQGMNKTNRMARRYHWLSASVEDFVNEPQSAICSMGKEETVLNLVDKDSERHRDRETELLNEGVSTVIRDLRRIDTLDLPRHHPVYGEDFSSLRLEKILRSAADHKPDNFEKLLGMRGVGPKTLRSLSLVTELIYGEKPSFEDPARYSFAHGGKDGYPFPVDKEAYDQSIRTLKRVVAKSKIDRSEKRKIFQKLLA